MSNKAVEKERNILRQKSLKATPIRIEILKIFGKNNQPLKAEDIYKKVNENRADLATIYRTLSAFLSKNLIKKINLGEKKAYYELLGRHHHHIVCIKCKKTRDFDSCNYDKLIRDTVKKSSDFAEVKNHSLEIFALCKNCFNRKKAKI